MPRPFKGHGMLRNRRLWLILFVVILGGLGVFYASRSSTTPAAAKTAAPTVRTLSAQDWVAVEQKVVQDSLRLTGTLNALQSTFLNAEVEAQVLDVRVRVGDAVKAGQILAKLDARTLADQVREQEALYATQHAKLALARQKLDKQRQLYAQQFISQQALDEFESEFRINQSQLTAQDSQLQRARKSLADTLIRAPFDGIIAERHIEAGQVIARNGKLFQLVNPRQLEIAASVPARDISRLKVGMRAQFRVEDQLDAHGQIVRLAPSAISGTRSFYTYVAVDNRDGRLRPGQFARGELILAQREQASLPRSAMREADSAAPWVMVIRQGRTEKAPVQIELTDSLADRVAIRGVEVGTQVIPPAVIGLRVGDTVTLRTQ